MDSPETRQRKLAELRSQLRSVVPNRHQAVLAIAAAYVDKDDPDADKENEQHNVLKKASQLSRCNTFRAPRMRVSNQSKQYLTPPLPHTVVQAQPPDVPTTPLIKSPVKVSEGFNPSLRESLLQTRDTKDNGTGTSPRPKCTEKELVAWKLTDDARLLNSIQSQMQILSLARDTSNTELSQLRASKVAALKALESTRVLLHEISDRVSQLEATAQRTEFLIEGKRASIMSLEGQLSFLESFLHDQTRSAFTFSKLADSVMSKSLHANVPSKENTESMNSSRVPSDPEVFEQVRLDIAADDVGEHLSLNNNNHERVVWAKPRKMSPPTRVDPSCFAAGPDIPFTLVNAHFIGLRDQLRMVLMDEGGRGERLGELTNTARLDPYTRKLMYRLSDAIYAATSHKADDCSGFSTVSFVNDLGYVKKRWPSVAAHCLVFEHHAALRRAGASVSHS